MTASLVLVVIWVGLMFGTAGLWLARYSARTLHGPETTVGPPRWLAIAVSALFAAASVTAFVVSASAGEKADDALLADAADVVRAGHPDSARLTEAMRGELRANGELGDLTVTYRGDEAEIQLWSRRHTDVRATVQREVTISVR